MCNCGEKWERPSYGNAKWWQCHAMAMPCNGNSKQQHYQAVALPSSGTTKQQQDQAAVLLEMTVLAAKNTTASSITK